MFGAGGCGPGGRMRARFMFGGPLKHLPGFGGGRAWLEGIDLSDEQVEKIAELKQSSFSKIAHGRIDNMELMQAIFKELAKPEIDKNKVAELKGKLKEQKATMAEMMVENMLSFAEILTAEQRKKIRIKKIRQFLGSEEFEHEPGAEPEHWHEHGPPGHEPHRHEHRHHPHD